MAKSETEMKQNNGRLSIPFKLRRQGRSDKPRDIPYK